MTGVETMEDALEELGGFGIFQAFMLFTTLYPELPTGSAALLPNYVGRNPASWECIVTDPGDNGTTSIWIPHEDVCSCNGTLASSSFSIVTEWKLVCEDSWFPDFMTSLFFAGMLVGAVLGSQVSDWIGRKKAMYLTCLIYLGSCAAAATAQSPLVFAIARMLTGYSNATLLLLVALYPMEFFTPKWRGLSGNIGVWGYGIMILGLFGYLADSWRNLTWMSGSTMLLIFLTYPFIPESPRWLLQRGKIPHARKVFDQMAKWNGRGKLEEEDLIKLASIMRVDAGADAVIASGGESGKEGENKKKENISQTSGYLYLMRDANYRLQIFKFMFMWFSVSLTYYLISFNTRTLSGDINLNMVYLGLVDAVAYPIAATVMITLGRKKAAVLYFTTGACLMLSLITVELAGVTMENKSFYITMLSLMAKFCFVSGWATCKGFTGESFPTTMRSSAYGICRIASSVGGILAPQILFLGTYNRAIPYAVVGCVAVTSAIITLTLKETKGKPIAED